MTDIQRIGLGLVVYIILVLTSTSQSESMSTFSYLTFNLLGFVGTMLFIMPKDYGKGE